MSETWRAQTSYIFFLKKKSFKRKLQEAEFYDDLETFFPSQSKEEEEVVALISYGLVEQCDNTKLRKYPKMQNWSRTNQKSFWTTGYLEWSDEEFKERLRLNRTNLEFILNRIRVMIVKQPTNMIPNPIGEHIDSWLEPFTGSPKDVLLKSLKIYLVCPCHWQQNVSVKL